MLINLIFISSKNTVTVRKIIIIRYQSISYGQEKPHEEKALLENILVVDKKYDSIKIAYLLCFLFLLPVFLVADDDDDAFLLFTFLTFLFLELLDVFIISSICTCNFFIWD